MRVLSAGFIACLLAVGGRAGAQPPPPAAPQPLLPTEAFSIAVHPAPEELKLAAHPTGLSATQAAALADFARQWMLAGNGAAVTVKAPEHGGDPASAYRTATEARDALADGGVPAEKLRIVGYEAGGDAHAPIVIGYLRYRASGPDCGQSWDNLASTGSNQPYASFGCAVTANIAAEIADPADLLAPRAETAADAGRREDMITKYRSGAATSTAKDSQASGSLASTGQ